MGRLTGTLPSEVSLSDRQQRGEGFGEDAGGVLMSIGELPTWPHHSLARAGTHTRARAHTHTFCFFLPLPQR